MRRAGALTSRQTMPAERPLARLGAHLRHRPLGVGDAEEVEEQRQVLGEAGVEQQRAAGDLLARQLLGVAVADPEEGAQHLQDRHERDRLAVRLGLRLEDLDPLAAAALGELVAEPALADPGFGDDRRPRRPRRRSARSSASLERRHLRGAADEAGEAALAGEVEPRARGADAGQLEDPDRPARALDLELAEVLEVEEAAGERRGVLGHVGLAGLGQRLHPLRQPDRVADRGVVAVAAADRPGDDLAGVDPDPGREVEPVVAAQLGRVLGDVVEHLQGRVAGAPARGPRGRSGRRRRP